jgi:Peptidase propeptide and YPEB domain
MSTTVIIAIVAGVVIVIALGWWLFGSSAAAEDTPKTKDLITELLEGQGYKVKEIEFDDGVYEVEAYKGGKEFEIKVDRTGKILKVEED